MTTDNTDDLPGAPLPYRYSRMMRDDPGGDAGDAPAGGEP